MRSTGQIYSRSDTNQGFQNRPSPRLVEEYLVKTQAGDFSTRGLLFPQVLDGKIVWKRDSSCSNRVGHIHIVSAFGFGNIQIQE